MYLPFLQERKVKTFSSSSTSHSLEKNLENIPSYNAIRALHRPLLSHKSLLIDCPFSFPETRPKGFCKQVKVFGCLPKLVHSALTSAFECVSTGLNSVFRITQPSVSEWCEHKAWCLQCLAFLSMCDVVFQFRFTPILKHVPKLTGRDNTETEIKITRLKFLASTAWDEIFLRR